MFYIRIKNTTYGQPRFLIECPKELELPEAAKEFGLRIARDSQDVSIQRVGQSQINLRLIALTYNIEETLKKFEKYTFHSDDGKPANPKDVYKVGDLVYTYQNPLELCPILDVRLSDDDEYPHQYKVVRNWTHHHSIYLKPLAVTEYTRADGSKYILANQIQAND